MNPVTLIWSWTKLLEILDMVCAMRSFETVDEDNVEHWLQSDACELGFQHDRHGHVKADTKRKGEEMVGRMRVKKKEKVCTSVRAWCYSVWTLY
jgi:hypothetical protein